MSCKIKKGANASIMRAISIGKSDKFVLANVMYFALRSFKFNFLVKMDYLKRFLPEENFNGYLQLHMGVQYSIGID